MCVCVGVSHHRQFSWGKSRVLVASSLVGDASDIGLQKAPVSVDEFPNEKGCQNPKLGVDLKIVRCTFCV